MASSEESGQGSQLRRQLDQMRVEMQSFGRRLDDLEHLFVKQFEAGGQSAAIDVQASPQQAIPPVDLLRKMALGAAAEPVPVPNAPAASVPVSPISAAMVTPPAVAKEHTSSPIQFEAASKEHRAQAGHVAATSAAKNTTESKAAANEPDYLHLGQSGENFVTRSAKKLADSQIDWEQLIGTRWMTWLGAFTLLLAVGFGVHWAWSTFHAPPWMHVACFHLLGVGFLVAAQFVRRRGGPITTRALVGLGIFTLYAAAFAALHLYHLWPERTAFFECAGLTVLAIALALYADSPAVVVLGALGGYLTPILTSSGSGNYVGLFTYLAFLNVALVVCAVWRQWNFLKPLALTATAMMFAAWLLNSHFDPANNAMVWGTEWLAALHAAIFLIGGTVPPLAWKRTSGAADLGTLVANSLLFVGITSYLFHEHPEQHLAWVSWGMSALHIVLFGVTYSRLTNADRMPRVHLALAAVFFTLAIPLQIDNDAYWGTTWCVEAIAITAVGVYFADRQLCVTGAIVLLLGAARLLGWDYHSAPETIGNSSIDLRAAMFMVSGLVTLISGGLYRIVPRFSCHKLDEKFSRGVAGLTSGVGAILVVLAPTLQLHDFIYLGPAWAIEAICFTVVGVLLADLQFQTTGLLIFILAAARLLAVDFASPGRPLGDSAYDARFAAFLFVGAATFVCGAAFRFARLLRIKNSARDPVMSIFSDGRPDLSYHDVPAIFHAMLMLFGVALLTLAPPLQLVDWALLGPIWVLEGVVLTVLSIIFYDLLLSYIGIVVFVVAVGRLIGWDFRAQVRLIEGTNWDLRFVVMEFSGLLAILAGAIYWVVPKIWPKRQIDSSQVALAGFLAGAGNIVMLIGVLCQISGRGVLIVWTVDAMILWGAGFYFGKQALRWYAAGLAVFMVGGRLLHDGDSLDGAYALLVNSRFLSMTLAAVMFFAAGGLYRRLTNRSARLGQQFSDLFKHGLRNLDESELDPFCGIIANLILVTAISFEIHSWYATAIAAGRTPFADMHMAEMATYSIVWAIYAAIAVAVGFAIRYPLFRFLGLAAFGIIAMKVFFVDLESLRWLPRVLALAALGLTLMGVSFLYQKYSARMQEQAGQ